MVNFLMLKKKSIDALLNSQEFVLFVHGQLHNLYYADIRGLMKLNVELAHTST